METTLEEPKTVAREEPFVELLKDAEENAGKDLGRFFAAAVENGIKIPRRILETCRRMSNFYRFLGLIEGFLFVYETRTSLEKAVSLIEKKASDDPVFSRVSASLVKKCRVLSAALVPLEKLAVSKEFPNAESALKLCAESIDKFTDSERLQAFLGSFFDAYSIGCNARRISAGKCVDLDVLAKSKLFAAEQMKTIAEAVEARKAAEKMAFSASKVPYAYENTLGNCLEIIVVGQGGIGSHFVEALPYVFAENKESLSSGARKVTVSLYDKDVIQPKNLRFDQAFRAEDIAEQKSVSSERKFQELIGAIGMPTCFKAEVVSHKTWFDPKKDIAEGKRSESTVVILCVDDTRIREKTYEQAQKSFFYWIDARAEGDGAQVVCRHRMWDENPNLLAQQSLPEKHVKVGCIVNNEMSFGHRMAAAMALQALVNWIHGKTNGPSYSVFVGAEKTEAKN